MNVCVYKLQLLILFEVSHFHGPLKEFKWAVYDIPAASSVTRKTCVTGVLFLEVCLLFMRNANL